ncbi:MAG: hypothetical protein ABIP13_11220 [Tepidiformaceae bacterium]
MRSFFHRQATYFIWGFVVALLILTAFDIGIRDLAFYAAISAAVGVCLSAIIFALARRFPDEANPEL